MCRPCALAFAYALFQMEKIVMKALVIMLNALHLLKGACLCFIAVWIFVM